MKQEYEIPSVVCIWAKEGVYAIDIFKKTDKLIKRAKLVRRPRIDCTVEEIIEHNKLPEKMAGDFKNFKEISIKDLAALYLEEKNKIGILDLAQFPDEVRKELEYAILWFPECFDEGLEPDGPFCRYFIMQDFAKIAKEMLTFANVIPFKKP